MTAPDEIDFANRLEIFFGDASDTVARVYARLDSPASDGLRLEGTLVGPSCLYGETLPATFAFVDRGPGPSLVAESVVPEPCFWTPDMPHQYLADIQLRRGDSVLARARRPVGIRALAARGRSLWYAGSRWVLRGVLRGESPRTDLDEWRAADAVMVVENPDDELCRQASRVGVLLVASLEEADASAIRRLARWPAVGFVVQPDRPVGDDVLRVAGNLVLCQRVAADEPLVPQSWATVAWCEQSESDARLPASALPVIAVRSAGRVADVAAGRALCDRLQRDLADGGRSNRVEVAGYVV